MTLPDFSMRQLLEAGVHFGHQTHRWNPKMSQYIFGDRNNIHIIDLAQTVPMLHQALKAISDTVAGGGRILFVGTKRQASEIVADAARRSAQYYVNARWLGGMLTNWKTISNSINRLKTLEEMLDSGVQGLTKKELLSLTRERDKLERALGGIKDMGGVPNMLFVVDTNKEAIAINEAQRLEIPVAAILDTNCDPEGVTFPIPGNDDAGRAIALYCDLVARAALDGISRSQGELGVDVGASEEVPVEETLQNGAACSADPVCDVAARRLDANHGLRLVTTSQARGLDPLQLRTRDIRHVHVEQHRLAHRRAREALRNVERNLRRGLQMIAPLADQRDRQRRNTEQKPLHCGRDGSGVDRVVAHVRTEVDPRDHHVRHK